MPLQGQTPAATYTTLLHTEAGKTGAWLDTGSNSSTLSPIGQLTILGGYAPQYAAPSFVTHRISGVVSGTDTTIFTVPASTKSIISNSALQNVAAAGAATAYIWVQFGGVGTKYRVTDNATIGAVTNVVSANPNHIHVFSAGDIVGLNTSAVSGGASISVAMHSVDLSSSEPLKTVYALDPGSGTTTIYTVPASTKALVSAGVLFNPTAGGQIGSVNGTGAGINIYRLLNGVAMATATSASANSVSVFGLNPGASVLAAAETLGVNWASANTGGWSAVTVLEMPA